MYISTLRRFIEAMDGKLTICAYFSDGNVKISQFENLDQNPSETTWREKGGQAPANYCPVLDRPARLYEYTQLGFCSNITPWIAPLLHCKT